MLPTKQLGLKSVVIPAYTRQILLLFQDRPPNGLARSVRKLATFLRKGMAGSPNSLNLVPQRHWTTGHRLNIPRRAKETQRCSLRYPPAVFAGLPASDACSKLMQVQVRNACGSQRQQLNHRFAVQFFFCIVQGSLGHYFYNYTSKAFQICTVSSGLIEFQLDVGWWWYSKP